MERSEGGMSLNNPVTPPGIDPGTVRLVAQRLNHYATPGPSHHQTKYKTQYWYIQEMHTMGSHIVYKFVLMLKIIY
jgi:hypothetical protein